MKQMIGRTTYEVGTKIWEAETGGQVSYVLAWDKDRVKIIMPEQLVLLANSVVRINLNIQEEVFENIQGNIKLSWGFKTREGLVIHGKNNIQIKKSKVVLPISVPRNIKISSSFYIEFMTNEQRISKDISIVISN